MPLKQTKKLSFNTYKYSVCLVVIFTSTDLATDKATRHPTPGYSSWRCHSFKQKDIATYHCTVLYLMLHCNQIIQIIPQWYSFSAYMYFFCILYSVYWILDNIASAFSIHSYTLIEIQTTIYVNLWKYLAFKSKNLFITYYAVFWGRKLLIFYTFTLTKYDYLKF